MRAAGAPTSPPGLRTRHWEGRPGRGPHSGQRRPGESDPALPAAEREPASEGGGPRLLKGEIAATRNPRPRLPPRKPVGTTGMEVTHNYLSVPRAQDPRTKPGRPRGAGQLGGVPGVGANQGAGLKRLAGGFQGVRNRDVRGDGGASRVP